MKIVRIMSIAGLLAVVGCVTPMSGSQIDEMTTCKSTTIEKIRKNLLLAGYEVDEQSKEDIQTGWKQVGGYGKDKTLRRLTVVKIDDATFKFKVRLRNVSVEKENQGSFTTTQYNKKKKKSESVGFEFGRDVERTNDYDPSYYVEYEADYLATRREVCGS